MTVNGLGSLPSLFLYDVDIKNNKTPLANTTKDPKVQAEITYFTQTVAKLKTVDDFMNNRRLVNFVLTSFGLQSESDAMGIVKKVLTQDPTDKNSLVNKLVDPRFSKMANALDFYHRGLSSLQSYSSTTTAKIQSGSVTLTLNVSPNFKIGQSVTFADSANPKKNFVVGSISQINGTSVTLSVPAGIGAIGSGTISSWTIHADNIKTGGTNTPATQVIQDLTQRYTTAQYENGLGKQSTPVEEAAYFLRNIGNVTNTYQLLGDRVLLDVVEGALGIPKNIAVQPVEDQKRLLDTQLDLKTLTNSHATDYTNATTDQTTLDGVNQVTGAAKSALSSVISQIQSIQQQYSFLPARTDPAGSNAATIAIQQASVPVLAHASGLINAANNATNSMQGDLTTLNALIRAAPTADATTLDVVKAQFQQLTQQIKSALTAASYTSPTDGSTSNLLTGTGALSATVKAGETINFTGLGFDAAGLGTQLDQANTAFQATIVGGSVDPAAASNLTTAGQSITTLQSQVTAQKRNLNQAIQDSGSFVAALDSGTLNGGLDAAQDAQRRSITVAGLLDQVAVLAKQSADTGYTGDRNALNTQMTGLIGQISTAIGTPGSGVADNLLTGGKSYSLTGSTSMTVRGAGLDGIVETPLTGADISTAASAKSLLDQIAGTIAPAFQDAQRQLTTDAQTLQTTITTFDPRAPIDQQLETLQSSMAKIEQSAGASGYNLLSTTGKGMSVALKTSGNTYFIRAHTDFDSQVGGALKQAVAALSTSNAAPSSLLSQALEAASTMQIQLKSDVNALVGDQSKVTTLLKQQAAQQKADASNPYTGASSAAEKLVERYLALYDSKNQTGPNSYLTQLLNTGNTGPSVINIDLTGLNFST